MSVFDRIGRGNMLIYKFYRTSINKKIGLIQLGNQADHITLLVIYKKLIFLHIIS